MESTKTSPPVGKSKVWATQAPEIGDKVEFVHDGYADLLDKHHVLRGQVEVAARALHRMTELERQLHETTFEFRVVIGRVIDTLANDSEPEQEGDDALDEHPPDDPRAVCDDQNIPTGRNRTLTPPKG